MAPKCRFLLLLTILLAAIAMAAEKPGGSMAKDIHWLGHDTFKIAGNTVIYTDPFRIAAKDKADLILITHEHFDHCSPEDVQKLLKADTTVVAPSDCAKKLAGKVKIVRPGDKFTIAGVEIEAVPAYNTNKQFHTKDRGWVGYIFVTGGKRIYLAGDTDFIPEMKSFKDIDIALLPVSGTYVMTADEAVEAALVIRPKLAIPMHYGAIVGSEKDADNFAKKLQGKVAVTILTKE
ncbi:MAG TPA: MBL fold metallo-hydrolase [Dissulfurispiraceae bacterium]|nr:MBL fold metallo-hydrolase [Dissulfurispiraceae bacterium]